MLQVHFVLERRRFLGQFVVKTDATKNAICV